MNDLLIRASAVEGQVRVFVGVTTNLIEDTRRRHNTSPLATAALGRAVTGCALMGAMLKQGQEVALQIMGDGPLGGIFAMADPDGNVRGYVRNPQVEVELNESGKLDVAWGVGSGHLYVLKDLGMKEPYKGSVPIVSGEIGDDLTYYFTKSEQTPSAVGLGVLVNPDQSVRAAGGFIVQLLPHAEEETIEKLEANLNHFHGGLTTLIEAGKGPEELLALLCEGMEYHITERREVRFKCKCSRRRLEGVVVGLGEEEAYDILRTEKKLELTCHFCNEKYAFSEEDVRELFAYAKSVEEDEVEGEESETNEETE